MARGIPALATGGRGNLDYMRGLEPLLVAHGMTTVSDPSGVYVGGGCNGRSPIWTMQSAAPASCCGTMD